MFHKNAWLTAGAVHVYLNPSGFDGPGLAASLAKASRRFALAVPVSLTLLLVVPLTTAPVATGRVNRPPNRSGRFCPRLVSP